MFSGRDNDRGDGDEGQSGTGYGHMPRGYPAGGGVPHEDDEDLRGAADTASRNAGDSSDSSMFGSILNAISQRKGNIAEQDLDEGAAVQHHKKYFGDEDEPQEATSNGMGAAAAMQALKMFSGGQAGGSHSQSQFIGLAMGEASKLFDAQNGKGNVSAGADKESAIQQAGEMALKMYMKSQGGSSGTSGLLSMASKFM